MANVVPGREKAPSAAPALPTPDNLFVFLEGLRQQGYRVDAGQIAAAERLLLDAHVAGPDSSAARRLKFQLAPVIAKTPQEQEDFYRQFDQWRGPLITFTPAPRPTTSGPATEVTQRDQRWLITAGVVATCIGLGAAASWYFWQLAVAVLQTEMHVPMPAAPSFYDGLKAMLMGAPILAFAAWLMLRRRRRALWLSPDIAVLDAELATVPLPVKLSQALFFGREFRDSAQRLRQHRYRPTRQLDVRKTVNATAARAGLFHPVYQERPHLPEYVFLIEQNSTHDHIARLFDLVIERLRSEDVFIQRYYFHTDPRQVQADDAARTLVPLADLAARTNDHQLIVIATADGFFHPLTGEVESWVHRLQPWRSRTILITRPLEQWTMRELRLLEEGFSLATVGASGFAAASKKIAAGTEGPELLEGVTVMPAPLRLPKPRPQPTDGVRDFAVFRDVHAAWCPAMVALPTGGDRFAIGRYPVTFEEYDHFCAAMRRKKPGDAGWGRGRRPVINVSWQDAQSYVEWLVKETGKQYRLPKEAEWEYAARAGTALYSRKQLALLLRKMRDAITPKDANYGVTMGKTTEVGAYPPNPWGLYDMGGNVWEWVEAGEASEWVEAGEASEKDVIYNPVYSPWDYQQYLKYGRKRMSISSERKRSSTRVLRGGSWRSKSKNFRSAIRGRNVPDGGDLDIGFRVARNLIRT